MKHFVDVVLSPSLLEVYSQGREGSLCVIIDVFRASTTMVMALESGASRIYPLEHTHDAERVARLGLGLVGAERNVERCPFAHFGNDPEEYTPERVAGRDLYFTTTNGTRAMLQSLALGHQVAVGGFVNLSALARYAQGRDLLCVCAGWQGEVSLEDALFAGALVHRLSGSHTLRSDAARFARDLYEGCQGRLLEYISENADHAHRLHRHEKGSAIPYCLLEDRSALVPVGHVDEQGRLYLTPSPASPSEQEREK